ncbi:unnamed protein product [Pleuronectes platessa]|uniref:Uncharacterized protein n=1 Tax=Pleuronectes platessa TaxID=8262 RepID=A0A9N7TLP2_PLEPL|nr:unnamed protein product [Pleuronectes platessa]
MSTPGMMGNQYWAQLINTNPIFTSRKKRQNRTRDGILPDADPLNHNHSLPNTARFYTPQPPGSVHRERAFDLLQESPSSFPISSRTGARRWIYDARERK